MTHNVFAAGLAAVLAFSSAAPAIAQEVPHAAYRETGSSRDWVGIYSPDRGLDKPTASCAIYSRPKDARVFDGDTRVEAMRGELAAFVSWPEAEVSETEGEVSFMIGMPVVEGIDAGHILTVDGDARFDLAGAGDRVYVLPQDDTDVVAEIREGLEMVVTARIPDGRVVKDTYSLLGVQRMTEISSEECR